MAFRGADVTGLDEIGPGMCKVRRVEWGHLIRGMLGLESVPFKFSGRSSDNIRRWKEML